MERTYNYAGYDIIVSYDAASEEYYYVIKNGNDMLFNEGPFDDDNDAFSNACIRINEET